MSSLRFEGVIKTWDDDRGFGFIAPDQGGDEVFVHIKAFPRAKAEFRATFWVTVVLNVAGFVVLCSPLGRGWLRQVGLP